MMGRLKGEQAQLFYQFELDDAVPEDHLVPRNLVHCCATDADDPTVMPRWGKVGRASSDRGPKRVKIQ